MAENIPYEIIASPFEVYITTHGDSFPGLTATPGGNWARLGRNGIRNQAEGGVTIAHEQVLVYHRVEGNTGPVKATRTSEDQRISFTLNDLRGNTYKLGLGGDAVEATGTTRSIGLSRGLGVREMKMLIRGVSPASATGNCQYKVPRVIQSGNPAPVFSKGEMAGLAFEFMTLDDQSSADTGSRFGDFEYEEA